MPFDHFDERWYDAVLPPVRLQVGKKYQHPEDGVITITSGCYRDPTYGRVSNWWYWTKEDGTEGKGYGDHWPEVP